MAKGSVFLIHWDQADAELYAEGLRGMGWKVELEARDGGQVGKAVKLDRPNAIVIYHTLKPSHGRATAEYLAETKATRDIPIIFVGGEGETLEKTKAKLPKARFIAEEELERTLAEYAEIA